MRLEDLFIRRIFEKKKRVVYHDSFSWCQWEQLHQVSNCSRPDKIIKLVNLFLVDYFSDESFLFFRCKSSPFSFNILAKTPAIREIKHIP